jgi:hypothetical protein
MPYELNERLAQLKPEGEPRQSLKPASELNSKHSQMIFAFECESECTHALFSDYS